MQPQLETTVARALAWAHTKEFKYFTVALFHYAKRIIVTEK